MKKLLAVLIALVGMFAFFAGVGCTPTQSDTPQKTATVELSGNPTTGYTWVYTISPDGVVKELSNEYVQDTNPPGAVGAGGTFIFTFEAVAEGEAVITFSYLREWGNNPAAAVSAYKAVVDANGNLRLEPA